MYGVGISREGSLLDFGVDAEIVKKSGAWYTYEGEQLGQGKEKSRVFLIENPKIADEIEKRIKAKFGVGVPKLVTEAQAEAVEAATALDAVVEPKAAPRKAVNVG